MFEKIRELAEKKRVSMYQLSKATGISAGNITNWKNGDSQPGTKALQKIAEYFKVPISYFYEDEPKEINKTKNMLTSEKEDELIEGINKLIKGLSDEDKRQVLNYVKFISQQKK